MATAIPGFPATKVRDSLRIPMRMGMPADPTKWPEFVFAPPIGSDPGLDANGYPWDPDAIVEPVEPETVQDVLCAFEPDNLGVTKENFGYRQAGVLVLTILDEEYRRIEGFAYVNLYLTDTGPPVRYHYRNVRQRLALDVVEVWQIEVATEDVP